jgi:hypothetical protein
MKPHKLKQLKPKQDEVRSIDSIGSHPTIKVHSTGNKSANQRPPYRELKLLKFTKMGENAAVVERQEKQPVAFGK